MKKNHGFTLFETAIVVSITLILGVILIGILVNNTGVYNRENLMVMQGLNVNDTMREIETYGRQAVSIADGYPEGSPAYITDPATLILKIPAINSEGVINNVFDYVVITRDSNNKILKEYIFPDTQSIRTSKNLVLTNVLESVLFEYLDNNDLSVAPVLAAKIKATVNLSSETNLPDQLKSSTIIINLRNL